MTIESLVSKKVARSRAARRTDVMFRRHIFNVVDRCISARYGAAYSTMCLQASEAICLLLKNLGIDSRTIVGSVRVLEVTQGFEFHPSWGGFEGENHHVWVQTEFGEVVDLTIGRLNEHPVSSRTDRLQPFALWWDGASPLPDWVTYTARPMRYELSPEDEVDLKEFLSQVRETEEQMRKGDISTAKFERLLLNETTVAEQMAARDEWMQKVAATIGLLKEQAHHQPNAAL